MLILRSKVAQDASNFSSHVLKTIELFFMARLKEPPDLQILDSEWHSLSTQLPSRHGAHLDDSLVSSFTTSFNPVDMYRLCHSFRLTRSPIPDDTVLAQSRKLRSLFTQHKHSLGPSFALSYGILDPGFEQVLRCSDDSDDMPIVIDSGASRSLTPNRDDFTTFRPLDSKINGIGAQSKICGVGTVRWRIIDMKDKLHVIETQAYYVPDASIRLYSPQFHFKENMRGRLVLDCNGVKLHLPNGATLKTLEFPFQTSSNLPLILPASHPAVNRALYTPSSVEGFFQSFDSVLPKFHPVYENIDVAIGDHDLHSFLVDSTNSNLSKAQKELLVWHWKLGHVDMNRLQKLMHPLKPNDSFESRESLCPPVVVPTKNSKTHLCDVPCCRACVFAKMTKKSPGVHSSKADPTKFMALSRDHLQPGDAVSVDQYIVSEKGRLLRSFGKEKPSNKYSGGTIYVDHASGKIFLHHQVSLRAGETLVGKRIFEREAHQCGFRVKKYHGDNGIFSSNEFRSDCLHKDQILDFSGVGAQHQNGRAERAIRTITSLARAMMIHSALHWPDVHDLSLWPMAMDHAVYIWNHLPSADGLSAEEKFSKTKFASYDFLRRTHVWGAPTYVLDPKLQDGKKLPKFSPRSRQGRFLGFSKEHSSSVALVLNPRTGKISPQFHCVFDDFFETVRGLSDIDDVNLDDVDWDTFFKLTGTDKYFDEEEPPPNLDDEWNLIPDSPDDTMPISSEGDRKSEGVPDVVPISTTPSPLSASEGVPVSSPPVAHLPSVKIESNDVIVLDDDELPQAVVPPATQRENVPIEPLQSHDSIDDARTRAQETLGRGRRIKKPNPSIFNDDFVHHSWFSYDQSLHSSKQKYPQSFFTNFELFNLDWSSSVSTLTDTLENGDSQRFFATMDVLQDPLDLCIDEFPTFALQARKSASADDNPRWNDAMNGPHRDGFLKAQSVEISTLQHMDAWDMVPRPKDTNILDSTWAFKIKRFPDGMIRKLKARFCVRGDQQIEGVDFFDTFAPVVQWSTVRLLLVISLILNLATKQVDYVSAFCQASIEEDVFIELPRGWRALNQMGGLKEHFKDGHVLKLNRSVYGLRQSPKNFFELLKGNLENIGFVQSKLDPCLFVSDKVLVVSYVDDCLWYSRDEKDIDDAIERMKQCGMDLQVEDDVAGFLGVHIERFDALDENGTKTSYIKLLQSGLIDRIIAALNLEPSNSQGCQSPAPVEPLPMDKDGTAFDDSFNYASVVGMCMYLCNNSRPDITFAVNQCARHSHRPTQKHAEYLRRLGRYLVATRDKGMIFSPKSNLKINCYVDADFAGRYGFDDDQDPHCVRSRTGYVIYVGGCPIVWKSSMQKLVSVSTLEAEYIAMSTACRDLLPLTDLVLEVADAVGMSPKEIADFHSTIWEDNAGAHALANMDLPRMTPRSKHIALKYHWFREHVMSGKFRVRKIGTLDQIADLFTKGLGPTLFLPLRKKLMGW
jgi:hypothetical protein